ncbi:MAG: hypothetical protein D6785_07280 [Planctomycetota bacterium]|nr:MAG: hypothetical protein D6785_07280 [Planctomycetota bacterium]
MIRWKWLVLFLCFAIISGCVVERKHRRETPKNQQPQYEPAGSLGNDNNGGQVPDPVTSGGGGGEVPDIPASGGNTGGVGTQPSTPLVPPPLPRVLVYLRGDKGEDFAPYVEETFKEAGFKLIDRDQLQNIKEVDAALSTNDRNKMRALKHRYGIEVILAGKVKSQFVGRRRIYGRMYDFYKHKINMKAIEADTAEIIYSKPAYTLEASSERKVIRRVKDLASLFAEKLKQRWAKKRYQGRNFDVVISRIPYKHLIRFENYLKKYPKVTSLGRRSYAENTAFYDVGFRGQSDGLENAILGCPFFRFKIVRTTNNRIDAEFKGLKSGAVKVEKGPSVDFEPFIEGTVDKPGTRVWVNGKEVKVVNGKWRTRIKIGSVKEVVIRAVDPFGNVTIQKRRIGGP